MWGRSPPLRPLKDWAKFLPGLWPIKNSIAFGSAPQREAGSRPISQSVGQSVGQAGRPTGRQSVRQAGRLTGRNTQFAFFSPPVADYDRGLTLGKPWCTGTLSGQVAEHPANESPTAGSNPLDPQPLFKSFSPQTFDPPPPPPTPKWYPFSGGYRPQKKRNPLGDRFVVQKFAVQKDLNKGSV